MLFSKFQPLPLLTLLLPYHHHLNCSHPQGSLPLNYYSIYILYSSVLSTSFYRFPNCLLRHILGSLIEPPAYHGHSTSSSHSWVTCLSLPILILRRFSPNLIPIQWNVSPSITQQAEHKPDLYCVKAVSPRQEAERWPGQRLHGGEVPAA